MPPPVDRRRIRLAAEAALRLVAARVALRVLPFRKIAGRLGDFMSCAETTAAGSLGAPADVEAARAVAWAIAAAARRLPFELSCLPRALAAQAMLRRRGVAASVYFGAKRDGGDVMEAHAWVDAAGIGVTGYPVAPGLRPFGRFATAAPRSR